MVNVKAENIDAYRASVAVYGVALLVIVYIGRVQELVPFLENAGIGKIVFALSLLLFAISPRHTRQAPDKAVQIKYVLLLFVFAMLSVPLSYWPGGSLGYVTQVYIKTLIFFFLTINVVTKVSEINKIIWAIACSVFLLGIAALFAGDDGRFSSSSTYDPNDLAFVMVTFLPVIYYFAKQKTGMEKILLVGLMILMLIATLATASRGGVVGLAAISAVISVKHGKNVMQAILSLIVVFVIVNVFASTTFWERMSTMLNPEEDYNVTATGGRLEIWKSGLKMMVKRPLTGVGVSAFEVAEGETHDGIGKWNSPHNSFIQIGAELGVAGLIIFYKLLKTSIKGIRSCRKTREGGNVPDWLLDGTEVAFYGYLITGFFLSQAYSPVLYLLVALAIIIQRLESGASAAAVATQTEVGTLAETRGQIF